MAYEGWMEFNGVEFINVARVAGLSRALGIDTVRFNADRVQWVDRQFTGYGFGLGGFGLGPFGGPSDVYDNADITVAPWYDQTTPASAEFAGFIPLSVAGLDDSTLESTPVEYIDDGGYSGKPRSKTKAMVFSLVAVATTDRGAEYGKRWLNRLLRDSDYRTFCTGADLRYFRSADITIADDLSEVVHRRDVRLTRGVSVTRKRSTRCASMWWMTFTMTAGDPYEYGEAISQFNDLGGLSLLDNGTIPMPLASNQGVLDAQVNLPCPAYDYTPIYDPLYPALVPAPAPPNLLPAGWNIETGMKFRRHWVRLNPQEPADLLTIPMLKVTSAIDTRRIRISVMSDTVENTEQCDVLFSAVVSYLPAGQSMYIDSEQKASYIWDGYSPVVRRSDSLVYSPDAEPVEWAAFDTSDGLLVAVDLFETTPGNYEGGGSVRVSLALTPKSD